MVPDGNSGYHDQEHVYNEVRRFNASWASRCLITPGRGTTAVCLHMGRRAAARATRWLDMGRIRGSFPRLVMRFLIGFEICRSLKCCGSMCRCQCWRFIMSRFKTYLLTRNQTSVKTSKSEKAKQWESSSKTSPNTR